MTYTLGRNAPTKACVIVRRDYARALLVTTVSLARDKPALITAMSVGFACQRSCLHPMQGGFTMLPGML